MGLFALVVVFQPELRRGLERIGRVGAVGRLFAPASQRRIEHVAGEVSKAAGRLSREGHGALIVLERETGLEEIAETGVMVHADLSHELLCTIFMPRTELHDGAVIIRGDSVLAAAALLPLTAMTLSERFGTRHRAALGITEDTDAVAVVVSEENGQMSVVERARIVRVPSEAQLERALDRPARGAQRPGSRRTRGRRPPAAAACASPRRRGRRRPLPAAAVRRPHRCRNALTRRARPPPPCRTREHGPRHPARRPGHRPQLAAQAGAPSSSPRCCTPGLVASQDSNTYPGPIKVDARQPACGHGRSRTSCATSSRSATSPRPTSAACGPRTSGRRWTSRTSSPTATRSTCG